MVIPDLLRRTSQRLAAIAKQESSKYKRQPWFSQLWYLSRYPDIASSGVDPWSHFCDHGWREGRDPSGYFATNWYRDQNGLDPNQNPLDHFINIGLRKKLQPHPLLEGIDHRKPSVAICLLYDSGIDTGGLTKAVQNLRENSDGIDAVIFGAPYGGLSCGVFPELKVLPGYNAADVYREDAAVRALRALAQSRFTHVAVVDPSVVTGASWLQLLLAAGEPIVGPVGFGLRREQAMLFDAFELATKNARNTGAFGRHWARTVAPSLRVATILDTRCFLVERTALKRLLNQDLNAFADVQFSTAARLAGFQLVVASHVLVKCSAADTKAQGQRMRLRHNFSQQSILELNSNPQTNAACAWAALGPHDSRMIDEGRKNSRYPMLSSTIGDAAESLASLMTSVESIKYRDIEGGIESVFAKLDQLKTQIQALDCALGNPFPLVTGFGDMTSQIQSDREVVPVSECFLRTSSQAAERRGLLSFELLQHLQPLLALITRISAEAKPVLVLCQVDPVTCDGRDGYAQRVIDVDGVLGDRHRIYVRIDELQRGCPKIFQISSSIWRLHVADDDPVSQIILECLFAANLPIYIHSLYAMFSRSVRGALSLRSGVAILDAHGAIPEELEMQGSAEAATYSQIENAAFQLVDKIVCVSESMKSHFREKYDVNDERFILYPIFSAAGGDGDDKVPGSHKRVIYAGGMQIWQKPADMALAIARTADWAEFLILTPDEKVILGELEAAGAGTPRDSVVVRGVSNEEVRGSYKYCQFGFLLRDSNVVNNVACPTKLIEYLSHDIIPIVSSSDIGDMALLGVRSVQLDEFMEGNLPEKTVIGEMMAENAMALHRLRAMMQVGRLSIRTSLKVREPLS